MLKVIRSEVNDLAIKYEGGVSVILHLNYALKKQESLEPPRLTVFHPQPINIDLQ